MFVSTCLYWHRLLFHASNYYAVLEIEKAKYLQDLGFYFVKHRLEITENNNFDWSLRNLSSKYNNCSIEENNIGKWWDSNP